MDTKRSDKIIVHEALAFIQCKLDTMDQVSLTQILTSSYTEEEILDAKKVLADTVVTTIRLVTRQRDGRGKRDIEDIFRVFLETDPDDVPTYVARDLHKLPPVTFDHVDVTRLLKDITLLKADVTSIRAKLEDSEKTVSELKTELAALRNKSAMPVVSPQSAQNVNARRGCATRRQTSPVSRISNATNDTVSQVNERPEPMTSAPETSSRQPALNAPSPAPRAPAPAPARQQKKSYAQVSRQLPPPLPASSAVTRRSKPALPTKPCGGPQKVDEEGFTVVEKKRRRPKPSRNQRGIAPLSSGLTLQVVEPTISIYISRLDPTTTGESIFRYVDDRSRCRIKEPPALLVHGLKRLETKRETNFKSYVLRVAAKYKDVFLAPDFWTAGVVYRRYREPPQIKKVP